MKTPREILIEKHRHAEPRLDAIRCQVLRAEPSVARPGPESSAWLAILWEQLILPCRRPLAALGLAWAVILLLQTSAGERSTVSSSPPVRPTAEVRAQLKVQWLLRADLLGTAVAGRGQTPDQPVPHSEAMPSRDAALRRPEIQIV
jgi:hypothetical protein